MLHIHTLGVPIWQSVLITLSSLWALLRWDRNASKIIEKIGGLAYFIVATLLLLSTFFFGMVSGVAWLSSLR